MLINLSINPAKTVGKIVSFIKTTVKNAGFSRVVVGLSGGIDSAVSTALAVRALGARNVYAGLFPYGELNKEGVEDARLIINQLNIPSANIISLNIKPLVDPIIEANQGSGLKRVKGLTLVNIRNGNIMARVRMILLYDLSKKYNALVLGTENKTENYLGYFTRFGDESSDIEPIIGLYKTQVWELAKYLKLPNKIIRKAPTAGMWTGQTDENEFGFTYEEADRILHLFYDKKMKKEEIIKTGFEKGIVEKVIKRLKANEFKHRLPYII